MLIRLLVVVLTLVGPLPFRVCTCAAALPVQTAPAEPVPARTTTKKCGCESHATHSAPVRQVAPTRVHADCDSSPTGDTPHQNRHERDCPATDPTPVVRDAVAPTAVDAPTDCVGSNVPVWIEPSHLLTVSAVARSPQPRAPKLPLYITLLSIQN